MVFKFIFIFSIMQFAYGQELEVVQAKARFPGASVSISAAYDNDDSIYLFGGYNSTAKDTIYQYNISADTIALVGTFPISIYGGASIQDQHGNILYFGGRNNNGADPFSDNIYKFNPIDKTTTAVGRLQKPFYDAGISVKDNQVFLVAGNFSSNEQFMQCLDIETLTDCGSAKLIRANHLAAVTERDGKIFIFGTIFDFLKVLDLATLVSTRPSTTLPMLFGTPVVIDDGENIFIVTPYLNPSGVGTTTGVLHFNTNTLDHKVLPVQNFPYEDTELFRFSSGVYVRKLNRIYLFGGFSQSPSTNYDEIWYIDMNPYGTKPPTTLKPSTPAPPPPPTTTLSCVGQPDGTHPHPHFCSFFMLCTDGVTEIYRCPEPLLFDPIERKCNFAEFADCNN